MGSKMRYFVCQLLLLTAMRCQTFPVVLGEIYPLYPAKVKPQWDRAVGRPPVCPPIS